MPRPCHARPCRSESEFSRPRHSAAWAWHGMCGLVSTVRRRYVGYLSTFGFLRLPRGVSRRLSEAYQFVKLVGLAVRIFPPTTRTFTKDTALSENGRGAAWHMRISLKRLKVMAGCYPHVVLVMLPFNFDTTALEDLACEVPQHAANLRLTSRKPLLILKRRYCY
jgi:hypothetical protein